MPIDDSALHSDPAVTPELAPGLYLVGTPIGNLEDITLRALRVLRSVNQIACEDTRQTQKLLNHFEIRTPTLSLHQHNERERAVELIAALKAGGRIAIVSDAGMPGISDPGGWLTQAAIAASIAVFPVPGANAALSALVASGFSTAEFHFLGFLPEKAGARRTVLESLCQSAGGEPAESAPKTLIFYEAPHRILDTLGDLASVWGGQLRVVVARELTKRFEEVRRDGLASLATYYAGTPARGEITVLVGPAAEDAGDAEDLDGQLRAALVGNSVKDAAALVAGSTGLPRRTVYARALELSQE